MIFATVGSHPTFAFNRFLGGLKAIPGDELFVQYGPGEPPQHARRAVPWLAFPEVLDQLQSASKVVSHAGAGTIMCATRAGHVPVVLPRLRHFGETVDDHQLQFARALSEAGRIILVEDADDIGAAIEQAPIRGAALRTDETSLAGAVRTELNRTSH